MSTNPGEAWRSGWSQLVADETQRAECESPSLVVELPDGTHDPGDRVLVTWTCHYVPKIAPGWGGMAVTVESAAIVPMPIGEPSPSPVVSPFA